MDSKGSPSGTAATIRLTPELTAARGERPLRRLMPVTAAPLATVAGTVSFVSADSLASTPLAGGSGASARLRPTSVWFRTATTAARTVPVAITEPS